MCLYIGKMETCRDLLVNFRGPYWVMDRICRCYVRDYKEIKSVQILLHLKMAHISIQLTMEI